MDFSSSPILRSLLISSSAIPPIVLLSLLNILFCFVGKFCNIGNTGPRKKTSLERKEVSDDANESKTSTTGVLFPSRAPKLWEKPAMPMESSLWWG